MSISRFLRLFRSHRQLTNLQSVSFHTLVLPWEARLWESLLRRRPSEHAPEDFDLDSVQCRKLLLEAGADPTMSGPISASFSSKAVTEDSTVMAD